MSDIDKVKQLRKSTGAGFKDCNSALEESKGDLDKAVEILRVKGISKASKKMSRVANEGVVAISGDEKKISIIEVNCETDFVAKDENFLSFVDEILEVITKQDVTDVDDLLHKSINDQTIEEKIQQLTAKIGEKLSIRRFEKSKINKKVGTYLHGKRIGVIVEIEGGDDNLAKDIAMHIAASKPLYVDSKEVSSSVLDKEKEIYIAQAQESGKPDDIIEKMVEGRLKKFVKEITLLGQPFVKDSEQSVEKILKSANAKVLSFIRYEVGEGIEKRVDNFAEEVMSQAKGN